MSNTTKTILIIVVLALAGGAYYWYSSDRTVKYEEGTTATEATKAVETSDMLATGADSSDSSLEKDFVMVDAQMSAFASDNASVDSGMNDQSVEQSSL